MQTEDAQTKSPFPSHFALDKMREGGASLNLLRKVITARQTLHFDKSANSAYDKRGGASMKSIIQKLSLVLFPVAVMTGCVSTPQAPMQDTDAANAMLVEQTALSVNWVQQSGEYRALAYQAFNTAKLMYDQSTVPSGKKRAVVADLDETLIDNSKEAAYSAVMHQPFESKMWTEWCQAKQADAIPGAVEFSNYVNTHGGTMFFVSNRKTGDEYQPTVDNLKALGFKNVTDETMLLKDKGSNKAERFKKIQDMGYEIVLYLGDNLDDFTGDIYGKQNADRRAFVDSKKADFGVKYIVLPNPVYGGFEGGLAVDYFKKTPEEKLKIRKDNMKVWKR